MAPMPGPPRRPPVPVRVLVLTSSRALPSPDWSDGVVEVVTVTPGAQPGGRSGPAARAARTLRRAAAAARAAATRRARPSAVWRYLRLDVPLGPALLADVVVSTDPGLDRAARVAADLAGRALVVPHDVAQRGRDPGRRLP